MCNRVCQSWFKVYSSHFEDAIALNFKSNKQVFILLCSRVDSILIYMLFEHWIISSVLVWARGASDRLVHRPRWKLSRLSTSAIACVSLRYPRHQAITRHHCYFCYHYRTSWRKMNVSKNRPQPTAKKRTVMMTSRTTAWFVTWSTSGDSFTVTGSVTPRTVRQRSTSSWQSGTSATSVTPCTIASVTKLPFDCCGSRVLLSSACCWSWCSIVVDVMTYRRRRSGSAGQLVMNVCAWPVR